MHLDLQSLRVESSPMELWNSLDEILQINLSAHVDRSGIDKLNRLAKKGFPEIREANSDFNPETSHIELTCHTDLRELGEYKLAHTKSGARSQESSLVVILMNGISFIVDGNHRINGWLAGQNDSGFTVIRITPRQASDRKTRNA